MNGGDERRGMCCDKAEEGFPASTTTARYSKKESGLIKRVRVKVKRVDVDVVLVMESEK